MPDPDRSCLRCSSRGTTRSAVSRTQGIGPRIVARVRAGGDRRSQAQVFAGRSGARARAEGYRLTMHCDVDQENSTRHIRQALDDIGVDRIDHGVNSLEDEALCDEIMRRGLALTVCPISNRYVTGSLKAVEIRRMLEKGMRATVNSDDPAYFPGYMNENLVAIQEAADLTRNQIVRLAVNAFEASWLPPEEKRALRGRLDRYVASQADT